ncbi:MAG: histidine kinase [Flavobacteriaceae bacterium]|nr:histidine kinase [Flavobacteriaceae bacterium]
MIKKLLLTFTLLLFFQTESFAQYQEFQNHLRFRQLDKASELINSEELSATDKKILQGKFYIENNQIDSAFVSLLEIDTLQLNQEQKAYYSYYLADAYDQTSEYSLAVDYMHKAQQLYRDLGLENEANEMNMKIYLTLLSSPFFEGENSSYLEEFYSTAQKLKNYSQLSRAEINLAFENFNPENPFEIIDYFDRALELSVQSDNKLDQARVLNYYGMIYGESFGIVDSAEKYYNKALKIYEEFDNQYKKKPIYTLKANLARARGDYRESIRLLKIADSIPTTTYKNEMNIGIYQNLANDYKELNLIDSAYFYMLRYIEARDEINFQKQNVNLARFEAEKKDKENLLLNQENERNRNLLLGMGGLLVALSFISFLLYTNNKKKQLIFQQKEEVNKQKTQGLLNQIKVTTIDGVLQGQEQERKKIASDLHDNLGARLTALRMNFQHLKEKCEDDENLQTPLGKTEQLLEETYEDIRRMSHVQNSGIMANEGLIPAVEKFIDAINSEKLNIEVTHFDMDERLSNNFEINLFRIIQELTTNIIKHAQATEASISITNHDNCINLMIEDNGIGFDTSIIKPNKGIGLDSIQEKVKDLNGKMEIDSSPGNGTTIILDLPIQ